MTRKTGPREPRRAQPNPDPPAAAPSQTNVSVTMPAAAPAQAPAPAAPAQEQFSWFWRRLFLFATQGFYFAVVGYALVKNLTSDVADTAVLMSLIGTATNVAAYVFGAAGQDIASIVTARFKRGGSVPAVPPPVGE